jgi:hypothetical protein
LKLQLGDFYSKPHASSAQDIITYVVQSMTQDYDNMVDTRSAGSTATATTGQSSGTGAPTSGAAPPAGAGPPVGTGGPPAGPGGPAPPGAQVAFALTPALISNAPLDFNQVGDVKLYYKASGSLDIEFDVEPGTLKLFLESLRQ